MSMAEKEQDDGKGIQIIVTFPGGVPAPDGCRTLSAALEELLPQFVERLQAAVTDKYPLGSYTSIKTIPPLVKDR
jgi:hypothetical protein